MMNTISNIGSLELATFLERNRITEDEFTQADIEWELLRSIGLDHESLFEARKESAEFFARVIQRCSKVHSVRWRVKNPEHLMEKIVRKRAEITEDTNQKYRDINLENYHTIITDLVGIRVIHLFKDDYIHIDSYLRERWSLSENETPIYYYRQGDDKDSAPDTFIKEQHPVGYRSIHYIFESQPLNKKLFTEIQVRTIFEEGWSEIDHVVRYPNFSDDPIIESFLKILNRLAGSADEMGTFAKLLANELQTQTKLLAESQAVNEAVTKEKVDNENEIEELLRALKELEKDNKDKTKLISKLESAVKKQSDLPSERSSRNLRQFRQSSSGFVQSTLFTKSVYDSLANNTSAPKKLRETIEKSISDLSENTHDKIKK